MLENVSEFIEEIEEEYLVLKDLGSEPNFPQFYGLYLKHATSEDVFPLKDQLWIAMEVTYKKRHLKLPNFVLTPIAFLVLHSQ